MGLHLLFIGFMGFSCSCHRSLLGGMIDYICCMTRVQPLMSRLVRSYKCRKIFLDQLAVGSSISFAATAAGGTSSSFKSWRNSDIDFAKDWDDALEEGTDFIE